MKKLIGVFVSALVLAVSSAVAVACPMGGYVESESSQQTVMTEPTTPQTPMPDKSGG